MYTKLRFYFLLISPLSALMEMPCTLVKHLVYISWLNSHRRLHIVIYRISRYIKLSINTFSDNIHKTHSNIIFLIHAVFMVCFTKPNIFRHDIELHHMKCVTQFIIDTYSFTIIYYWRVCIPKWSKLSMPTDISCGIGGTIWQQNYVWDI